jgi:hypothetical protein
MKTMMILLLTCGLYACTHDRFTAKQHTGTEVLTVQADGTMYFRERAMSEDDVIIYADGFGGERAAVKVYVPLKNDFYRDSIKVYRVTPDPIMSQN